MSVFGHNHLTGFDQVYQMVGGRRDGDVIRLIPPNRVPPAMAAMMARVVVTLFCRADFDWAGWLLQLGLASCVGARVVGRPGSTPNQ